MSDIQEVIRRLHDAPHQGVLAVSGAGSQAVAWLLGVSGASRTILEVVVPYGRLSMIDLVGFEPDQFVSQQTALNMAEACYRRAVRLREGDAPVVGLACTATIATDRPKRGEHRAFIATWDELGWASSSLRLEKGHRDRAGEEELVSRLVVAALCQASGIEPGLDFDFTEADDLVSQQEDHPAPLQRLLNGEVGSVVVGLDGDMQPDQPLRATLLPGSFNPLHHGHLGLAQAAAAMSGNEVVFELSITNVDKPPLDAGEVAKRLDQFQGKSRVVLTRAETYQKKARLFPGCAFAIGWDTAIRLVAPRYYGDSETAMLTAIAEMWAAGCSFLVAGRKTNGDYHTLDDVPVPEGFRPLFQAIPESAFRVDISSTFLRSRG